MPTVIARYYIALGELGRARELLELAYDERAGVLVFLNVYPMFDALRDEEGFRDLVREIALPRVGLVAASTAAR